MPATARQVQGHVQLGVRTLGSTAGIKDDYTCLPLPPSTMPLNFANVAQAMRPATLLTTSRMLWYAVASTAAVTAVVLSAFIHHNNFYSATVYLSRSSRSSLVCVSFQSRTDQVYVCTDSWEFCTPRLLPLRQDNAAYLSGTTTANRG
jgi:hypothetical protein